MHSAFDRHAEKFDARAHPIPPHFNNNYSILDNSTTTYVYILYICFQCKNSQLGLGIRGALSDIPCVRCGSVMYACMCISNAQTVSMR